MKFLMKWGKKLEFNDFVMLKTRFYWIINTKTNVLILGLGHVISNHGLGVG